MRRTEAGLLFSPHDLTAYLGGDFVAWMDRLFYERDRWPGAHKILGIGAEQFAFDADDPELELIKNRGFEHEAAYQAELTKTLDVCPIADDKLSIDATLAAMRAGRAVIAQGELRQGRFGGRPDFLVRTPGPSNLGDWHYLPRDTKLARSIKPEHVIQLCVYAQMLEAIQGVRPAEIQFVLGDGKLAALRTNDFLYYCRRLQEGFFRFHDGFDPKAAPQVGLAREVGRWSTVANLLRTKANHISLTARVTINQIQRLEAAGVRTMQQLAARTKGVPRMRPEMLARLSRQARLQLQSNGQSKPVFEIVVPAPDDPRRGLAILPPASPADVYFDMEGFPLADGGLEYLFGAVTVKDEQLAFHDWWAHDTPQERRAFEQFIDWVHARWRKHPDLHVYHYAAYETAALRRLMGKHASREAKVDDLLRAQVFVDLYTVVRQGTVIGTPGYSLKDIECLFAPPRTGAVKTAAGSVVAYQTWIDAGEDGDWRMSPILKEIRDYNEIDCRSLWYLQRWLLQLQKMHKVPYVPPARR